MLITMTHPAAHSREAVQQRHGEFARASSCFTLPYAYARSEPVLSEPQALVHPGLLVHGSSLNPSANHAPHPRASSGTGLACQAGGQQGALAAARPAAAHPRARLPAAGGGPGGQQPVRDGAGRGGAPRHAAVPGRRGACTLALAQPPRGGLPRRAALQDRGGWVVAAAKGRALCMPRTGPNAVLLRFRLAPYSLAHACPTRSPAPGVPTLPRPAPRPRVRRRRPAAQCNGAEWKKRVCLVHNLYVANEAAVFVAEGERQIGLGNGLARLG